MVHKKLIGIVVVILFLTCVCFNETVLSAEESSPAKEVIHKMVYINADQGINPTEVVASPGTTVVWINNSNKRLQLRFLEQQVTLACAQPVNFYQDENKCYISNQIPLGAVASLCFIQKGEFKYRLRNIEAGSAQTDVDKKRFTGIIKIQ
jgi:plastocyanin